MRPQRCPLQERLEHGFVLECWQNESRQPGRGMVLLSCSLWGIGQSLEHKSASGQGQGQGQDGWGGEDGSLIRTLLDLDLVVYQIAQDHGAETLSAYVQLLDHTFLHLQQRHAGQPQILLGTGLGASAAVLQAARQPHLTALALCDVVADLPIYFQQLGEQGLEHMACKIADGQSRDVRSAATIIDCPVLVLQWEQAPGLGLHEGEDVAMACQQASMVWLRGDERTMLQQQAQAIGQFVNDRLLAVEHQQVVQRTRSGA